MGWRGMKWIRGTVLEKCHVDLTKTILRYVIQCDWGGRIATTDEEVRELSLLDKLSELE